MHTSAYGAFKLSKTKNAKPRMSCVCVRGGALHPAIGCRTYTRDRKVTSICPHRRDSRTKHCNAVRLHAVKKTALPVFFCCVYFSKINDCILCMCMSVKKDRSFFSVEVYVYVYSE